MVAPNSSERLWNIIYAFFAVNIGILVLFVSVSRASLNILAQESNEGKIAVKTVNLKTVQADGAVIDYTYKLPEVNMLPSQTFYGFRKVRDWMWLFFSRGDLNKAKISLVLADKKMSEVMELANKDFAPNNGRLIIEAGQEALDRLKYTDNLISQSTQNADEWRQLHKQCYTAGLAYVAVMSKLGNNMGEYTPDLNELMNEINVWNEKQKEDQEGMEI